MRLPTAQEISPVPEDLDGRTGGNGENGGRLDPLFPQLPPVGLGVLRTHGLSIRFP